MRYIYHRDNFGNPRVHSFTADVLRKMFCFCSPQHRLELDLFLKNDQRESVEFEFKDGDKVVVSKNLNYVKC